MEWSTACPDWEKRLVEGRSIIPPPIFADEAERALAVFKQLRVPDLPNKPTFGECCDQWVFDFVAAIFGAYDAETGNQLIREFYLLISKKNTKSTIAAGIMLTALILCERDEEEHLILAPTREVADNSFRPAAAMVRADDDLMELFNVQDYIKTISHRVTRSTLKVVAADTETVSGKKAGKVLVDEHWVFGTKGNAEAMFMEALGGQVSRDEGWVIFLTTQSDQPPAGVFRDKLLYYRSVRDGLIVNRKALGVLYEFPQWMLDSKAYLDPANFYVTNPNLGRSVSAEWLEDKLKENREKTSGGFQQFLAKHLNVEIGLALRSDRWPGADFWPTPGVRMTLEEFLARVEVVDAGVDGGGLDDLLGLALAGRERGTGRWLSWCRGWCHPSALKRNPAEAQRFRDFDAAGDLVLVERVGDDVEQVADIIFQVYAAGLLDKVGVDVAGIGAIVEAIHERGVDKDVYVVGVSQGWRLAGAIKTTERKLAGGELVPDPSPFMAWCVGNAKVEPRANSMLITKQASGSAKIDPLMALFNAVTLLALNPEGQLNQGCVVL